MNDSTIVRTEYYLHHMGTKPGRSGTARTDIWFDAEYTTQFATFLTEQVNVLGIQGTITIVQTTDGSGSKVQLIIDDSVDVDPAASAWINGVNQKINELDLETITGFSGKDAVMLSLAADPTCSGRRGTSFEGGPWGA